MKKSIFDEIRSNPNFSVGKSRKWYTEQIKSMQLKARDPRLLNDPSRKRASVEIGFMYMFGYVAKGEDSLPYYDRFPLTFVYDFTPNGFYGINFHYLPYDVRFKLFDLMVSNAENKTLNDKDKLKLNWSILKNASRFPQVRPAVKRYLIDNVQTSFVKIPLSDWKTALLLPVEQFVGANVKTVWADSRKTIRSI